MAGPDAGLLGMTMISLARKRVQGDPRGPGGPPHHVLGYSFGRGRERQFFFGLGVENGRRRTILV